MRNQKTSRPSFTQIVERPDRWPALDANTLEQYAPRLFMAYATENDPAMLAHLLDLYHLLVQRLSTTGRNRVIGRLEDLLPVSDVAARALLPIIDEEPEPPIIARACLNLVWTMPLHNNDELTGPRYLLSLAERQVRDEHTRVGVLQGLILLGDRRMWPLFSDCWKYLGGVGQSQLAKVHSQMLYSTTVEFLLHWLEQLDEERNQALFGDVASALVNLAFSTLEGNFSGDVLEIERHLPCTLIKRDEGLTVKRTWTIEEYGQEIAPRLARLVEREQEPKVLPTVQRVWGIYPHDPRPFVERAPALRRFIDQRSRLLSHRR